MPHISSGNYKMGNIPNISLSPTLTCGPKMPCFNDGCYARAIAQRNVIPDLQWKENTILVLQDPDLFFEYVYIYLKRMKSTYFRWHVAGEIPTQRYLDGVKATARNFPKIRFLCFTKKHSFDFRNIPPNLSIVFSMWPGWGNTKKKFPRAWVQDGTETRLPETAMHCSGKCQNCKLCWHLKELNHDVWFYKHK